MPNGSSSRNEAVTCEPFRKDHLCPVVATEIESNMLKDAIESADDNLIDAGADFSVSVTRRKLFSRSADWAEPPTMAVFHHVRLHIFDIFCTCKVH
jgi:hypothetical protein